MSEEAAIGMRATGQEAPATTQSLADSGLPRVYGCQCNPARPGNLATDITPRSGRLNAEAWLRLLCLAMLTVSVGCARFSLPAIDPTGQRIFLPPPNSTQLELPRLHSRNDQPGIIPQPAYQAPPKPPACPDPYNSQGGWCSLFDHQRKGDKKISAHFGKSPGKRGEIQMTPLQVVAPVDGEVVLLAGICGEDGYLVKRQPLEWMLSPDSVGTFIEVGDDSRHDFLGGLVGSSNKVEKLDVDFARGRTSSRPQLITRGSPQCSDDIDLQEGQTWLSISSPSEGVSRVTVLAPDSEIWDRRRQTAVIYWVDAQWQFPQPATATGGEQVRLVTRVNKAENLVPAEGWLVRYTIVDPNLASFTPASGIQIEDNTATTRVDANGQAIVALTAPQGTFGTTPVLIEVIRPAQPSDRLPKLTLGRGQTFVTFSSPGLNLAAFGPEVATAGEQLTYVASLGNPGDINAENVKLSVRIPNGTRLVTAVPQPQQFGDSLVWDQGILPAGRQLDVSVVLEPLQMGAFDVVFQAEGAPNLAAQAAVRTRLEEASVAVRFEPADGVAQAEVGSVIQYEIDVTNTGRQAISGLKLLVESDPGLPEAYQSTNRVERELALLQPGETSSTGVAFRVQQEGQLQARLRVFTGENVLAEKMGTVLGQPARPKQPDIGVSISGFPQQVEVGRYYEAIITLRNPGETRLTEPKVELQFDSSIVPVQVDRQNASQFRWQGGQIASWTPPDLLRSTDSGGDMIRQLKLGFEVVQATADATIQVRASAKENVQADAQLSYRAVEQPRAEVSPPPQVTPPQRRSGNLTLVLDDFDDPTVVGNRVRYSLRLTNDQNLPVRNATIELRIPDGLRFEGISREGISTNYEYVGNDRIRIEPIEFMRSQESVRFVFIIVPEVAQPAELNARAYSDENPNPVTTSERTTINPRP